MVLHPSMRHKPNQSPTGDGSRRSLTPPAMQTSVSDDPASVSDATATHRNPLNFHVSANMDPRNRETPWDLLIGGFQAWADEEARVKAARLRPQPQFSPPPPPPGGPNPLNYRAVWLCPKGKKAHIHSACVKQYKPYKMSVMPGSFEALNWCQPCSNKSLLDAHNKTYIGCDGAINRHEDNPWGELE